MDIAQWPQEVGLVKPMEEMISSTTCSRPLMERKTRPPKEQGLNCPRCNSTNTKFCYYNNYSLTQPRYFCKTCRRYWTEGGTLRNVPVGGGTRKNKRSSSSASASVNSKKIPDVTPSNSSHPSSQNPKIQQQQDLNLAFQPSHGGFHNISEFVGLQSSENHQNPSSTSFQELLRSGISSRGLASFMPMPLLDPNNAYPSGFGLHDFRPTLNFSLDGIVGGYGNIQGANDSGGKILFPMEDVKQVPSHDFEQHGGQGDTSGYWNGMLH